MIRIGWKDHTKTHRRDGTDQPGGRHAGLRTSKKVGTGGHGYHP